MSKISLLNLYVKQKLFHFSLFILSILFLCSVKTAHACDISESQLEKRVKNRINVAEYTEYFFIHTV